MDQQDNALGDRFRRSDGVATATANIERRPAPADARAEAERRLHEAWLAEQARQAALLGEVAPAPALAQLAATDWEAPASAFGRSWDTHQSEPQWIAPRESDWSIAQRAAVTPPAEAPWVLPQPLLGLQPAPNADPADLIWIAARVPQASPADQAATAAAPVQPVETVQPPQVAAALQAAPADEATPIQAAQEEPISVAPQRAPSSPPSDDATLRGGPVEDLEHARRRLQELRELQEWRLAQERRALDDIERRRAQADAAIAEELQARRQAEEERISQWRAKARATFERDLAREELDFERRFADRRRAAEAELEVRLQRRLDEAARRAEALENDVLASLSIEPTAAPIEVARAV